MFDVKGKLRFDLRSNFTNQNLKKGSKLLYINILKTLNEQIGIRILYPN